MTDERETPGIFAAMHEVMKSVQAVAKRDRNTHQNFSFRGIDSVVNALGPAFREHGVIVTPNVREVTYEKVHTTQNKPVTACRILANFTFYAVADGSSIVSTVAGEAYDSGDKATPKAMSVAFRTALLETFSLPTDEPDPDSQTYEQARPNPMTKDQVATMGTAFGAAGMSGPENSDARAAFFADLLGRETRGGDLTSEEAEQVMVALAERSGPTPEQEAMLSESLGATPIEEPPAEPEGPRAAAARVGAERRAAEEAAKSKESPS